MTDILIKNDIRRNFEWLHEHPELAYHEYETTKYIKEKMKGKTYNGQIIRN